MPDPDPQAADQEEVIEEKPKSILLGLMKQLTVGMDLTKVTRPFEEVGFSHCTAFFAMVPCVVPTFVLEPRSLLERYTDFLTHADLLLRSDLGCFGGARLLCD